jgi:ribose 5-phosphate isomerase B
MSANKVKRIRAAVCQDTYSARMSREHNNANVLCMGERVLGPGLAKRIVKAWLEAEFSAVERHSRRVAKIRAIEDR